ncbi:proteasome accessory factor C [Isoptericola variabilis J7]|uniref:helix-turn-helix transcriptional regulator n=1 Tax=Isoptericola variabilis TaxID=139208 RepID=UPI0011A6A3BB|nr:WYL domain-containing protein [Isoptericola variabilis]TWH28862.1 proteasome accessory factor C [Isoptericola variabilis J7]
MAERADDRLVRLLGLVAYLDGAGPVRVEELARRFGVSPRQVREDVDALWVSGTPGYMPDDLIDFDAFSLDEGVVHLTRARGMTRPLRLGTREAVALVAALRAMHASPPVQADPDRAAVVGSALAKLTAATDGRRLRIRYVNAADVASERDVDPVRLLTQDERTYLVAWCLRAGGRRTFRADRILAAEVLEAAAEPHDVDPDVDVSASVLASGGPGAPVATLVLASPARWVAEEVPAESVRDLPDGSFEVRLRVTNPAWLRRLLLSNAPDVRAVAPPEVAADVAAAARAALAAYGEASRSDTGSDTGGAPGAGA